MQLKNIFGEEYKKKRFAVRSSASGEDSEEMSAAGQMQTFLGVSGLNNIMESIVACWASQFSFTAIQYKRQNGQLLNSPMAVVIQEMVPAEVAGVLFTCDPVTGNPSNITVTANYGIGESVVSATAEPDTIVFDRLEDSSLALKSTLIGRKNIATMMSDDGGVVDLVLDESKMNSCCLSPDQALELCQIAAEVERAYGCPLDIEWAICGAEIFLLQARPITTLDQENVSYAERELHYPVTCEDDYVTQANIGEVWNGVIPALSVDIFLTSMSITLCKHFVNKKSDVYSFDPIGPKMMASHLGRGFINLLKFCLRFYKKDQKSFVTESIMISGFGRLLDDPDILKTAEEINKFHIDPSSIKALYGILKDIVYSKGDVLRETARYVNKEITISESQSINEAFMTVLETSLVYKEPFFRHVECTTTTSMVNTAVMHILVSAAGGWKQEVFSDLAKILSSGSDVLSADVPAAIDELAASISASKYYEHFRNMDNEQAMHWLKTSGTEPGIKFRHFLKEHGHRCVDEFDIYSKPWRVNPLPVVESLKEMLRTKTEVRSKTKLSISETIAKLSVPLTWKSKIFLWILIPLCRRAVGSREMSKSLLVHSFDMIRKPLVRLSERMVEEGRLPDQDLFYFLTVHEIIQLLDTRSPKLIQKAMKRRSIMPRLQAYRFPEISKGFPKPLNKKLQENGPVEASFTMKGTAVSEGVVKARCRVAVTLEEAKLIKAGEILIAIGTDIGWSPYFPMLAGIATELGGLVSHGAVVAREYGLPCVVGVHGATDRLKSGDLVVLNGTKGLLQKVES